jgi:hypothetical protein
LGVAVLAGALTFGASLGHLLDTPRLYGLTFDLAVTNYQTEPPVAGRLGPVVAEDDDVEGYAVTTGTELTVDGQRVEVVVIDAVEGDVLPPVLEGRAAVGRGEIAFGSKTLEQLGLEVGDTVTVAGSAAEHDVKVVGRSVLPGLSPDLQLGHGGFVSVPEAAYLEGASREKVAKLDLALRLASGTDADAKLSDLRSAFCREGEFCNLFPRPFDEPIDVVNFGRVRAMPYLLAGILGLLAVGALVHVLTSAVQRRRRDLAVLKTLGFTRRQVRAVVAWQATVIVFLATAIGAPVGVAVGRLLWRVQADELGIVFEPRIPWMGVIALVVAGLLLANLIAALPAGAAARLRPARILRSE